MKLAISTICLTLFYLSANAQLSNRDSCKIFPNLNFRHGLDTITTPVIWHTISLVNKESKIMYLDSLKIIDAKEFINEGNIDAVFFLPNCSRRFTAPVSRKVIDKTYLHDTRDLAAYMKEPIDINALKHGERFLLKFVVFQNEETKNALGEYFFCVIDIVKQ